MSTVFLPYVKNIQILLVKPFGSSRTYFLRKMSFLLWKTCKILQWYDKLPQDTLVCVAMQTILFQRWFFDVGNEIKFTAASVPHFVTGGRGEKGGIKHENIGRGLVGSLYNAFKRHSLKKSPPLYPCWMFFGDHKIFSGNLKGGINKTQAKYRLSPWRKIMLCFENEVLSGRGTQLRSVPVLCNHPFYHVNCKPKGNKSEGFFSSIGWTFLIVRDEIFNTKIDYLHY